MATRKCFFNFLVKGHKIGEILALLTTELSSYKICKVGMLFCIHRASIKSKFQYETLCAPPPHTLFVPEEKSALFHGIEVPFLQNLSEPRTRWRMVIFELQKY